MSLSRKSGNLACKKTEATAYAPGKSEWRREHPFDVCRETVFVRRDDFNLIAQI